MNAYFDTAIILKLYVQEATSPDAVRLANECLPISLGKSANSEELIKSSFWFRYLEPQQQTSRVGTEVASTMLLNPAIHAEWSFKHGIRVNCWPPDRRKASRPRIPISSIVSRQSETKEGQITSSLLTPAWARRSIS
jgi:hypothetical protein